MPTLGASARRFLCGWRRDKEAAAVLVALALLAAQQRTIAATRDPGLSPWRSAQATSSPQPVAAAPSPQNDDKTTEEKTSVPATVVDGEQLEAFSASRRLARPATTWGALSTLSLIAPAKSEPLSSILAAFSASAPARSPLTGARCISTQEARRGRRRSDERPTARRAGLQGGRAGRHDRRPEREALRRCVRSLVSTR